MPDELSLGGGGPASFGGTFVGGAFEEQEEEV